MLQAWPVLSFLTETLRVASGMVKANLEVMWRYQGVPVGEESARKEQTAEGPCCMGTEGGMRPSPLSRICQSGRGDKS